MNPYFLPLVRAAVPSRIRRLSVMVLLSFFAVSLLHAKPNQVELPLILESERQQVISPRQGPRIREAQRSPHLSENCAYELIVAFGFLEKADPFVEHVPEDREPVGLHLDSDPDNVRPEPADKKPLPPGVTKKDSSSYRIWLRGETLLQFEFTSEETRETKASSTSYSDSEISARINHEDNRTKTSGTNNRVPLHWMAESLAIYSEKNVLMSARLEKRWCPEFRLSGSSPKNVKEVTALLETEGAAVKLIGHDTYVLVEAPGKEQPFPYAARARAMQYEGERETWLTKYADYAAQGLIYQPTKQTPSYPKRDVRVRHAAAALAKLTGKEVFVQPLVEKREFKVRKDAGQQASSEQELDLLTRQLDKADVRIVELNPQSLALVAK